MNGFFFKTYEEAETTLDNALEVAKVTKIILEKLDPKASKEQKAQAKKDHEAKAALVNEQLPKMTKSAGGVSCSMRTSLAITLGQNGTRL